MGTSLKYVRLTLVLLATARVGAQNPTPVPPMPVEPITAILGAFRTHEIVAISDPHGNVQLQTFLRSLIHDARFPAAVEDIVIETLSARYQDAIDRFVRGDDVARDVLRKAWEDHTVPGTGTQVEDMLSAVRAINASLGSDRKVRVIAGDPPIDWDSVRSREDHRRWIELRDSYPADLIRRQVLERGRRALVVYGQGHLQRRQIVSNYDMSTWQAQTVVSLLERDAGARVFNIWTLLDRNAELPEGVASWRVPSLAIMQGTTLGAADFGRYFRGLGDGTRFAVRNVGAAAATYQLVPLSRDEWKTMRMEDQFNALLYLGAPSSMTDAPMPVALCQDAQFVKTHLERLALFGPQVEVDNFKKACGAWNIDGSDSQAALR